MTTLSFRSHLLLRLHFILCFIFIFLSTIKFWPAGMDSQTVTANQNGQDANSDLPLLSSLPLLCGSPSLLCIWPPHWPGVFLLSFYLFKVRVTRCPPFTFPTVVALLLDASFNSSFSFSLLFVSSEAGVASQTHTPPRWFEKPLFKASQLSHTNAHAHL